MTSMAEYLEIQSLERSIAKEMIIKIDKLLKIRKSIAEDVVRIDKEINKLFMEMREVGIDIREDF